MKILDATQWNHASANEIHVQGGFLFIGGTADPDAAARFSVSKTFLEGGRMTLSFDRARANNVKPDQRRSLIVQSVTLEHGRLNILAPGWNVLFKDCIFKSGELFVAVGIGLVSFEHCTFESDLFKEMRWSPTDPPVAAAGLLVQDCRFLNDAINLEQFVTTEATIR